MSERRTQERRRLLLQIASAAVFIGVLAVAVLIVIAGSSTSGGDTSIEEAAVVRRELAGIPQRGMALGDPTAPTTLIEFGDLKCPHCADYARGIVPEVIESQVRTGKGRIEFRNFPVIDSQSAPAGAAALAAGAQGRAWQFVEIFYRNQGSEASAYADGPFLTAVARAAGVPDMSRWESERRSSALLARVRRTSEEARGLGFTGTPSFAVQMRGAPPTPIGTPGSASEIASALEEAR